MGLDECLLCLRKADKPQTAQSLVHILKWWQTAAQQHTVSTCVFCWIQCNIGIKRWFKSHSAASTKRLQNIKPKDRWGSVRLASFCVSGKQKCFTEVCPCGSVGLTVAWDDWLGCWWNCRRRVSIQTVSQLPDKIRLCEWESKDGRAAVRTAGTPIGSSYPRLGQILCFFSIFFHFWPVCSLALFIINKLCVSQDPGHSEWQELILDDRGFKMTELLSFCCFHCCI